MFNTSNEDVLSMETISNAFNFYLFTCDCRHRYIGRTIQRLGERVRKHVPMKLVRSVLLPSGFARTKRKPDRPKKNPATNVQLDTDGCDPVSSRPCSHDRCGTDVS